jgi:hypothetical protein
MENFGFKGLLATIYQRVILSYRTTLIAMAIAGADVLIQHFSGAEFPSWVHTTAAVFAAMLALVKEQKPPKPPPVSVVGLILVGLMLSSCVHVKSATSAALDCAAVSIVQTFVDQAKMALGSGTADWTKAVDDVVKIAGPCVVNAALAEIRKEFEAASPAARAGSHGGATALLGDPPQYELKMLRAEKWLDTNGL